MFYQNPDLIDLQNLIRLLDQVIASQASRKVLAALLTFLIGPTMNA